MIYLTSTTSYDESLVSRVYVLYFEFMAAVVSWSFNQNFRISFYQHLPCGKLVIMGTKLAFILLLTFPLVHSWY